MAIASHETNLIALARALKVSEDFLTHGADSDTGAGRVSEISPPKIGGTLQETILDAKIVIADMAGIAPDQVRIQLDY